MSLHMEDEEIICDCGNEPSGAGFDTCDRQGRDQEPLVYQEPTWEFTYRCNGCGLIVEVNDDYTEVKAIGKVEA